MSHLDRQCPTCLAHQTEPCRYIRHKANRGVNEGKTHYSAKRVPHKARLKQ